MRVQRINEKNPFWVLPFVLVNNCLDVEFDVLLYKKLSRRIEAIPVRGAPHYVFASLSAEYARSTPALLKKLTRFAIQAEGPDSKWTRKPLAYRGSNNVNICVICPPEICVNLVFKHIHAASSYTIRRRFDPFIYCPL